MFFATKLRAKVDGTNILLEVRDLDASMRFLGCSLPTSVRKSNTDFLSSLVIFCAEMRDEEVIALSVTYSTGSGRYQQAHDYRGFLRLIRQQEEEGAPYTPYLVLDELVALRVPSQVHYNRLEVKVDGAWVSTKEPLKGEEEVDPHYVPDGNLLCRYLVGKATAREVRRAFLAERTERRARFEVPKLRADVRELESLLESTRALAQQSILARTALLLDARNHLAGQLFLGARGQHLLGRIKNVL